LGINSVYLPFRVPRADLENFLERFNRLPVEGYSVTIPHKEMAASLAPHKDAAVMLTHAANTLIRSDNGFKAFNTDYQAARESLLANLPPSPDGQPGTLNARTALLLGAGGVARAMAHALQREGALLSITNRTPDRTHQLAEEVGCRVVDWAARHGVTCEILVNCTSVGMHPNLDDIPIHPGSLKPGLVVMDCIYTPETTLLVKEARHRGCHVITGVDMFVRQAALQFELFTGQEPPLDLMRKVVKHALSPVVLPDEM
jgi:3-dehydroquinate dehydratase/shikimate dehydrogenase